jgi:hypothetical protein
MSRTVEYGELPGEMISALRVAENVFDPNADDTKPMVIVHGVNQTRVQFSYSPEGEDGDSWSKEKLSGQLLLLAFNQNVTGLISIFEAHRLESEGADRELLESSGGIKSIIQVLEERGIPYRVVEIVIVHMDQRDTGDWIAMAVISREGEDEPRVMGEWEFSHMDLEEMRNIPGPRPLMQAFFLQADEMLAKLANES